MINIEEFLKVELKVGTVLVCEEVEGSEKLLKLQVDLGSLNVIPAQAGIQKSEESHGSRVEHGMTDKRDIRQILSGVRKWYTPEDFIGKQVVVIANLEPRMMMGIESWGMLLAVDGEDGPVFLMPAKDVTPGSKIR